MGLLGGLIVYSFGKRRGRKQATRRFQAQQELAGTPMGEADCLHYWNFCRNFGSCDGMVCEKGE